MIPMATLFRGLHTLQYVFFQSELSLTRLFEYGSGGSTLWWASRVKEIFSVEHDKYWFQKVSADIPPNVKLIYIDLDYGGAYSKKIGEFNNKFDIIIIDGRDRINCVMNALQAIKPDGVFIWDNSDREAYREGYDYLLINGYNRIDFEGMGPINLDSWCTSVFYRKENCIGI